MHPVAHRRGHRRQARVKHVECEYAAVSVEQPVHIREQRIAIFGHMQQAAKRRDDEIEPLRSQSRGGIAHVGRNGDDVSAD